MQINVSMVGCGLLCTGFFWLVGFGFSAYKPKNWLIITVTIWTKQKPTAWKVNLLCSFGSCSKRSTKDIFYSWSLAAYKSLVHSHLRRLFHTKCNRSALLSNRLSGCVAFLIPKDMKSYVMTWSSHDINHFELLVC